MLAGLSSKSDLGPSARTLLLLLVVAVHLLLILWLVARPAVREALPVGSSALVLVALSNPGSPAPPTPKPIPPARVANPVPLPPAPISAPSSIPVDVASGQAAPSSAPAFGSCQLTDQVASAIRADPAAIADLAALPQGLRTEADAVMLWNGRWLGQSDAPTTTPTTTALVYAPLIGNLQRAVLTLVSAAPTDCRDAAMTGPVFMAIPESGRTTTLVIGSGTWRWADLLSPENAIPLPLNPASPR